MSGHEVSSVISSILSAFGNGMDIFRRMRTSSKSKKRIKEAELNAAESQLHDSLQRRPEDIRNEYDRNAARLGKAFEKGDSTAQTSLAHILLVLNTGLMNIINQALSKDSRKSRLARQSLLDLSETAGVDALQALSQLSVRLTTSQLSLVPNPRLRRREENEQHQGPKTSAQKSPPTKVIVVQSRPRSRPSQSPLLARGGWVRSKSGSSMVSAASASKLHSPGTSGHQRSKSSPAAATGGDNIKNNIVSSTYATSGQTEVARNPEISAATKQHDRISPSGGRPSPPPPRPRREPSMLLVPADFFSSSDLASISRPRPQSESREHLKQQPPSIPPKIPISSNFRPGPHACSSATSNLTSIPPNLIQNPSMTDLPHPTSSGSHPHLLPRQDLQPSRARPVSVATFKTASTKIGEIPEHRWIDHPDPHHQQRLRLRNSHSRTYHHQAPFEEEDERQGRNEAATAAAATTSLQRPLPYIIPPPLTNLTFEVGGDASRTKKAKFGGLRFWKRSAAGKQDAGIDGRAGVLVF